MSSINLSLCLSDIPKEFIFTSEKTGKKYVSLYCGEKKEADQYGKTHFLKVDVPKEKRQEGVNYYCGSGKAVNFEKQAPAANNPVQKMAEAFKAKPVADDGDEDLPF